MQKVRNLSIATAFCVSATLSTASIGQGIAKCQDADGNWHYGNFADEACAQESDVTKLNAGGEVVGVVKPPPTKEELEAEQKAKKERDAANKVRKQQIERDQNIVRIYGSEEVILATRDRKIESIDGNIQVTEQLRQGIVSDIEELKTREQTKKVKALITERENAIKSYDQVISQSKVERNKIEAEFADILERFRSANNRLTSGS